MAKQATLSECLNWLERQISREVIEPFLEALLSKHSNLYAKYKKEHPEDIEEETPPSPPYHIKGGDTAKQTEKALIVEAVHQTYQVLSPIINFVRKSANDIFQNEIVGRNIQMLPQVIAVMQKIDDIKYILQQEALSNSNIQKALQSLPRIMDIQVDKGAPLVNSGENEQSFFWDLLRKTLDANISQINGATRSLIRHGKAIIQSKVLTAIPQVQEVIDTPLAIDLPSG